MRSTDNTSGRFEIYNKYYAYITRTKTVANDQQYKSIASNTDQVAALAVRSLDTFRLSELEKVACRAMNQVNYVLRTATFRGDIVQ